MAFGQQPGPPASTRQIKKKELLALLNDAGHTDFRDVRGPMGFTQRQAAGKFTQDEAAAAFIAQLQGNELEATPPADVPAERLSAQEQLLRHLPAEQLAAELRRRGWAVTEPVDSLSLPDQDATSVPEPRRWPTGTRAANLGSCRSDIQPLTCCRRRTYVCMTWGATT